jgi:hypothetical protein
LCGFDDWFLVKLAQNFAPCLAESKARKGMRVPRLMVYFSDSYVGYPRSSDC